MRYIRYAVLAVIAVVMITVALANRSPVTLNLMPQGLSDLLGYPAAVNSVSLPLFLVILIGVVAGLMLGFVFEWLREHKHRSAAAAHRREASRLAREVKQMKSDKSQDDDVLALLE